MKTKYIKPETQLLDINLDNYLQTDVAATTPTKLGDDFGKGKGNDWVFDDDYDEGDGLW
ncbi:MAG: hypothetical protein LUC49_01615 [Prevotella sp.]|nr:hypothetical protein [Prevotella sp.]